MYDELKGTEVMYKHKDGNFKAFVVAVDEKIGITVDFLDRNPYNDGNEHAICLNREKYAQAHGEYAYEKEFALRLAQIQNGFIPVSYYEIGGMEDVCAFN